MSEIDQEEKLRQEILADARTKAERALARARNLAESLVQKAKDEAVQKHDERIREANDEAEAKCRAIMLDVQREARRYWLNMREQCLEALFAKALANAAAATGESHAKSLRQLAEEAMGAIGPRPMTVTFPQADSALVTAQWLGEIACRLFGEGSKASFTLNPQPDAAAGLLFASDDQARSFDNSYASRLAKMKDELRKCVM